MDARRADGAATRATGTEFRALGPLAASRDGVEIELGPRKQRAVLAILLLNANRVVPTERLIDELWGDAAPETARSALQVYVAGLRKALGDGGGALATRAPGYVLTVEEGALDVDRFVALRDEARASDDLARRSALLHEALRLWRDEPLAELDGERFATEARLHLEELRLGALEERIDADLALGRHAELVPELDALATAHPYRERLRGQQMLALYRSGRQADALAAYRTARAASVDELGLEPGPELRALERAMLDQDPRLEAPPFVPGEAERIASRRGKRSRLVPVGAGLAVLVAVAVGIAVVLGRGPGSIAVSPNTVGVIDASTGRVVAAVPVGVRPGPMAVQGTTLWVVNEEDGTLSRLDTRTRAVVKNVPVSAGTPSAIAAGAGAVWVVHGRLGLLSRVDFDRVTDTIPIAPRATRSPTGGVDVEAGSVWAVSGDVTLTRVSPRPVKATGSTFTGSAPSAVVAAYGSVWVSNVGDSTVRRYSPVSWRLGPTSSTTVGSSPRGLAAGGGALWVANYGDDTVTRLNPTPVSVSYGATIPVGDGPAALAYGAGSVWVANRGDGTVSRIDPERNEVVGDPIAVGAAPSGLAVVGDEVWVAVQAR